MRCDGSPDPTVPGEINTYINLRLEDSENNDIDSVMKQGQQDIAVSTVCKNPKTLDTEKLL